MQRRIGFCLILCLSVAIAYDTGHHTDLTRNVMQLLGFNPTPIEVAVLCNWQIDYYAYTEINNLYPLNGLHFDNMYNLRNVSNYFNTLASNTRSAIQSAVKRSDVLAFIGLIGASTHPVQDFYTHSSWTDLHPFSCNCYRDDTWFSALASVDGYVPDLLPNLQSVITYSWGTEGCATYLHDCTPGLVEHGDYCSGINKDSYVRPKFESSYSHAFAATYEWVYNILLWADEAAGVADFNATADGLPGVSSFVQSARRYTPAYSSDLDDLTRDVEDSILISYAAIEPKSGSDLSNGHWKGPGSGSYSRFGSSVASFVKRSSIFSDLFTEKRIWENITTPNPYYQQPGVSETNPPVYNFFVPYSEIPEEQKNFTKIRVRTTNVTVPNMFNTPSPYALIVIDGQEFEEAIQNDDNTFSPHWTAIKYVKANSTFVDIKYSLWNDEFPSSDNQYSLSSTDDYLYYRMNVYSHQLIGQNGTVLNGTYDNIQRRVNITNDGVNVLFYVDQVKYGNCSVQVWPESVCPAEAYGQYLLHPVCGADKSLAGAGQRLAVASWWILFTQYFLPLLF